MKYGKRRYVIIGNGGAAFHSVSSIREVDKDNEIIVIGEEGAPPYSPVLLPHYLEGTLSREDIYLCDRDFYERKGVKFIEDRALGVDVKGRRLYLDKNQDLSWDLLLIATGSLPDIGSVNGRSLSGVFTFLRKMDAERIREGLKLAERVAVVGSGLIGMHTLEALFNLGKRILLIEALPHILPNVIDEKSAEILQNWIMAKGVELRLGDKVVGIEERGKKRALLFESSYSTEVDMVILATGVKPNTGFLDGSGIRINRGVVVDEYSKTNIDGVYAAGDIAESEDILTGEYEIKATWINAADQGRVAGLNMAGLRVPNLRRIRLNISSTLGLPFAAIGIIREMEGVLDEIVIKRDNLYKKYLFYGETLVGAVLLGEIKEAGIIADMIGRRREFKGLKEGIKKEGEFPLWSKGFLPNF